MDLAHQVLRMKPDAHKARRLVPSQSQPDALRLTFEQRSNLLLLPNFPAGGVEAVIDKAGNFGCCLLKHRRPCRDGNGKDIVTIGFIVRYDPEFTHAEPLCLLGRTRWSLPVRQRGRTSPAGPVMPVGAAAS